MGLNVVCMRGFTDARMKFYTHIQKNHFGIIYPQRFGLFKYSISKCISRKKVTKGHVW